MHDSKDFERRFPWCQHCGGDKPWAREDWIVEFGQTFCCAYCQRNFQAFLFRMAQKKKRVI